MTYVPAPSAGVGILLSAGDDFMKSPAINDTRSCIRLGLPARTYCFELKIRKNVQEIDKVYR